MYWPALVPSELVPHRVVLPDGRTVGVPPAPGAAPVDLADPLAPPRPPASDVPGGPVRQAPLAAVAGARSGDKGGNANLGVWARSREGYAWLERLLTVERLRELLPEAAGLDVRRYELPNLLALNFLVRGLLGEGAAASTRPDPQAKGLGEQLRACLVDVPVALLDRDAPRRAAPGPAG